MTELLGAIVWLASTYYFIWRLIFENAYITFFPLLALTSINYTLQVSSDNYLAKFYPYSYWTFLSDSKSHLLATINFWTWGGVFSLICFIHLAVLDDCYLCFRRFFDRRYCKLGLSLLLLCSMFRLWFWIFPVPPYPIAATWLSYRRWL